MDRRTFFSQLFTTGILLKLTGLPAKAHQSAPSRREALGLLAERGQLSVWWYVVPNHPLMATQDDHWRVIFPDGTRGEWGSQNKLFRDADGRVRIEEYFVNPVNGQVQELSPRAYIADRIEGELKTLFLSDGTATKHRPGAVSGETHGMMPGMQSRAGRSYENIQTTPLSTRILDGIECHGLLITASFRDETSQEDQPTQETLEEWVAPRLFTPLLTRIKWTNQGSELERVVRLSNIREGEHDPTLFQIPSGFRIIDPEDAPKYAWQVFRQ